ncbi:MAG: nitroreductase family deazaflavin-dependent oxidoreductase [Candidatus Limnocylindrales bacterium]
MDDRIRRVLDHGQLIDITTTGRRTGQPRRIEISLHNIGGHLVISGMPRRAKRAWLLNLEADPAMTVHLKGALRADVGASARVISDEDERRPLIERIARTWGRSDVDAMVARSPLIEVIVPGYGVAAAA